MSLFRCLSLPDAEWNRSTSNGQWYRWAENYQMISMWLLINNYVNHDYYYFWRCLSYIIPKTVDIHTMLTKCFSIPLFRKRKQFRRFVGRPTKLLHQVQNHNCLSLSFPCWRWSYRCSVICATLSSHLFHCVVDIAMKGNLVITLIIHDGMNIKTIIVISLKMISIILVNHS